MSTVWQQLLATSSLEWFGTATGLAAVALSIRQLRAAWPVFIACYAAYAWLSFDAQLFAAAGMNAVFVVLSLEGWRAWSAGKHDEALTVRPGTPRVWVLATATWLGATLGVGTLLSRIGHAESPWLDAAATTSGFVAQWLLTRKQIATWTFWLLSDVLFMILFASAEYWVSVGLFAVFVALAIQGARTWARASAEMSP